MPSRCPCAGRAAASRGAALERGAQLGGDRIDPDVARLLVAPNERNVTQERVGRRAALQEHALPRIGPQRNDVEGESRLEEIRRREHAAVGYEQRAAAILDERREFEIAGAAAQFDHVRTVLTRLRRRDEQQPLDAREEIGASKERSP